MYIYIYILLITGKKTAVCRVKCSYNRAKEFVVPSTLTRCITARYSFKKNAPGTFFNATHQVKQLQ